MASPYEELLDRVFTDVTPYRGRPDAAGYMAFVPGFTTWPSAMADLIASALNLDSCWWAGGAGMTQLELTVLEWFAEWIGYPPDASGVLTSGGSAANLTALACARERLAGAMRDDLVVYISAQSHSSVARAARALGFRPERVRVVPVDRAYHLRLDVLERAVSADRAAGLRPLVVCANAGTTNTGAVDPLHGLADLCAAHGLWLHVDAAYGGFAVLSDRGRAALSGIERADSVTLDPHKWLFQPFECGALLVRDPDGLRLAFEILPDYLRDVSARTEVNFSDRGLQLSRMCRALKVWMSIQAFGLAAFRGAVDHSLDLAEEAAARVEASDELELLAPVELSVVALRRVPPGMTDERRDRRRQRGARRRRGAVGRGVRLLHAPLRPPGHPAVHPQSDDDRRPGPPRPRHHREDADRRAAAGGADAAAAASRRAGGLAHAADGLGRRPRLGTAVRLHGAARRRIAAGRVRRSGDCRPARP